MIMEDRLHGALAAEHAAIFGYGIAGARLEGALLEAARQAEAAHRSRRDALLALLTQPPASAAANATPSATPPPAEPAYALPFPVTDVPSALRLAVHLEERTASVWRHALGATTGDQRRLALDALVASAVLATRWRVVAGVSPTTVPLP